MLTVSNIMSHNLITLPPTDSIRSARQIMEKARIRHLPIMTKLGKFVGIVTQQDITKASVSKLADLHEEEIAAIEAAIPLAEIMSTNVRTVPPHFPIKDAALILLEHKFGCLPIVEDEVLKGILTESDFIKLALSLMK